MWCYFPEEGLGGGEGVNGTLMNNSEKGTCRCLVSGSKELGCFYFQKASNNLEINSEKISPNISGFIRGTTILIPRKLT